MEENASSSYYISSSANVTDDREACPANWYVARVQMNCERTAAKKIASLGIETYVPTQTVVRQWSDRKKKIEKILIPLLVFFRAEEAVAKQVQRLSFVYDLLKAPGEAKPAIIPDNQIQRLKFMIGNCDSEITIRQNTINKGDRVRVVRGSLKGLEGFAATSADGTSKISIVIEDLFCASVSINPLDLEKA